MSKPTTLILTTTAAILLAFAGFNSFQNSESLISDSKTILAFEEWQSEHNKAYSPNEKMFRLQIFKKSLERVQFVNSQDLGYKLELNSFSDMTEKEKNIKLTGYNYDMHMRGEEVELQVGGNPKEQDWRKKGAVTSVKNQGHCGQCWAFQAVHALEGALKIKSGDLHELSVQQLVDCQTKNHGCRGGLMTNAFKYIKKHGLVEAKDYPYTARDGKCKKEGGPYTLKSYKNVPRNGCAQLETAVAGQTVSVAVSASGDFFQYKSGIYDGNCQTRLNHGVTAVGYGEQDGKQYYLIKNQWGNGWGEEGYIRVAKSNKRGSGKCGICTMATYVTV